MLTELAMLLWRRRLTATAGLLVALALAATTVLVVPPTYKSTAQILFVPSTKQPGLAEPTNPLLYLNGSVAVVANTLQIQVSDERIAAELAAGGLRGKYEVVPNLAENAGPVLILNVEDPSPEVSQSSLGLLIQLIQRELRARQSELKVPDDLAVTTVVLTTSHTPVLVRKVQLQLAAVVFAAGLLMTVAALALVERRRSTRRRAALSID